MGRHSPKIVSLLAAALAALAVVAAPAAAPALPPQGLYDQCSPAASGDACASRLDQMSAAGFKVVLNYTSWDATPDQLLAFADAAAARGMQVIWPLNHAVWRQNGDITSVYPKLAAACGCTRADQLLGYVTGLLAGRSATWGWYVGDELPALELPAVLLLNLRVKLLDPAHPTLYVAYEHSGIAGANLLPFATAADVVGTAIYPYGTGADPLQQMDIVSALTRRLVTSRSRAMVLQSFDWAQHPDEVSLPGGFPTAAFMRKARDAALASSPRLLLWYSFADIQKSDDPAGHWRDLRIAAFGPAGSPWAPTVTKFAAKQATKKTTAKKSAAARRQQLMIAKATLTKATTR